MKILLKHGHLVIDGTREYLDGAVLIEDERIKEVFPQTDRIRDVCAEYLSYDLKGALVMPGFFDTHTHGIGNLCFDSADEAQMDEISRLFARDGTTSYLATLSYDLDREAFCSRLKELEDYESPCARFAGIHMEGPFLSAQYCGAGDPEKFLPPDPDTMREFLACSSRIRQMTIACELEGAKEVGH